MSKTVALIIHARKDSTRCRNKHLRPLGNTTLIDIAIEKANQLKNINEVYIAAYDQELKDKARGAVKILDREYDSVSPGNAHHSIMYRHLKDVKSDFIINFNPCQPFLDINKIQSIIDWFISSPIESAITVKNTRN